MAASSNIPGPVEVLLKRGVVIPCPASVEVGADINPDRIAKGVVIHAGCRLSGANTSMAAGCEIGAETPATVEDCQLGRKVELKGGFFSGATFLDGANVGSGAHIRPGTLLEEEAGGAHTVAFKQTVLLPFVTAGSLINFCDCLMAGGTSRKNHSEIGSSYIHFNYTPHQDKATVSLIGDVPRGVMLDQPPVFLGGQGGLIGPSRIGFGCVIPAGVVFRGDSPADGMLLYPPPSTAQTRPYHAGSFRGIARIVANNLVYIGNIRALDAWYRTVRAKFMGADPFSKACYNGALAQLGSILAERIRRLAELATKMPRSLELVKADAKSRPDLEKEIRAQERLFQLWQGIETALQERPDGNGAAEDRDRFLAALNKPGTDSGYLETIRGLDADAKRAGTAWLQSIVDSTAGLWS